MGIVKRCAYAAPRHYAPGGGIAAVATSGGHVAAREEAVVTEFEFGTAEIHVGAAAGMSASTTRCFRSRGSARGGLRGSIGAPRCGVIAGMA